MYLFHKTKSLSLSEVIRLIAIWGIVLLPFQNFPRTLSLKFTHNVGTLSQLFLYSDEGLTAILIIVLISWNCLHGLPNKKSPNFSVFYILLLFIFTCLLGMFINHIGIYRGALAIFDYTKNIAVAVLFYWLGFRYSEFKKGLILFVNVGLLVAVIGILGVALSFFTDSVIGVLVVPTLRFGLHRLTSVAGVGSLNYIGVYAVLVFWLLFAMKNEFNHVKIKLFILFCCILLTVSRQSLLSFFLMFLLLANKKTIVLWIIAGLSIVAIVYVLDIHLLKGQTSLRLDYRIATYSMCFNYLKDNLFWGVGPGMLGGLAAQKLWSPLYSNLEPGTMWFLIKMRGGLDQFWGRLFADVGIIGGGIYVLIFVSLGRDLIISSRFFTDYGYDSLGNIAKVLAFYILVLAVMGLAGGLNAALLAYPFFAFSGIIISLHKNGGHQTTIPNL